MFYNKYNYLNGARFGKRFGYNSISTRVRFVISLCQSIEAVQKKVKRAFNSRMIIIIGGIMYAMTRIIIYIVMEDLCFKIPSLLTGNAQEDNVRKQYPLFSL